MKKYILIVVSFFLVCSALPGLLHAQTVAIMGAEDPVWNEEVRLKIEATGLFDTVDAYDLTTGTPTLGELENYCAVLAYTGDAPNDPVLLGDNLADYVDGGGGVVAAVFATASIPIEGRFNDDNYWAIQPTDQQQGTQETLGEIFVTDHPILDGVSSFDGGTNSYRPSADSVHPEAVRVANWTGGDNIPLIATRAINGVPRVDLGFFPPSTDSRGDFWDASTDGALIMANALDYICTAADLGVTKSATPEPAIVGESVTYTIEILNNGPGNATGLIMTDTLPLGVEFVSVDPAAFCNEAAGVVTCVLSDLAAGESLAVVITVIPQSEGMITNEVTVVAEQTDVNPDNNSASVNTTVIAASLQNNGFPVSGSGCSLNPATSASVFPYAWILMGLVWLGWKRVRR